MLDNATLLLAQERINSFATGSLSTAIVIEEQIHEEKRAHVGLRCVTTFVKRNNSFATESSSTAIVIEEQIDEGLKPIIQKTSLLLHFITMKRLPLDPVNLECIGRI